MGSRASGSSCSELLYSRAIKRLTNSRWREEERAGGFLPKNKDSAFGNFLEGSRPRIDNSPAAVAARGSIVPRTMFNKRETACLSTQSAGAGGFKDSDGHRRCVRSKPIPPKAGAFRRRAIEPSLFRFYYDRGDIPVRLSHSGSSSKVTWQVPAPSLDYHRMLPLFCDGIREKDDPYRILAVQGTLDLLEASGKNAVLVVPQLIMPLKKALNTRDPEVMATALKVIQKLLQTSSQAGEALVPYYRQLLPCFNLFISHRRNLGSGVDYAQRRREDVSVLIEETLKMLEETGGPDAFVNIKYMVPIYESQVLAGR